MNSDPLVFDRFIRFWRRVLADGRFYERLAQCNKPRRSRIPLRALLSSRGLWLLTSHRIAYFCHCHRNSRTPLWWIARVVAIFGIGFKVWCCRSEILAECQIGGNIYLPDKGYLICGARSIGDGSIIHDHCTIGHRVAGGTAGRPAIGRNVWIGPNCIVAGSVLIGDGATILPSSLVTFNVPARTVVGGNPARVVRSDFDNSLLRKGSLVTDWRAGTPR